ncbi:MAG: hypothetical protein GXO73_06410 [Calditrichaeota bacterium]|nr:hypothetical protein [Calditrichota bacterium]
MRKATCLTSLAILLGVLSTLLGAPGRALGQACDTVTITKDIMLIPRDPKAVAVRSDKPYKWTKCAVNVRVAEGAYYKIYVNTKNDLDQPNESYFLTVLYPDSSWSPVCDPNLGYWRVVPDTSTNDTTGLRYAGTFYFRPGVNKVLLEHYARIVNDYPDLWIGPSDSASIANGTPNSVHVYEMMFEKSSPDQFDLVVSYVAATDTLLPVNGVDQKAVFAGQSYRLKLTVTNLGVDSVDAVTIWATVPDSVSFGGFSLAPSAVRDDTVFWEVGKMYAGDSLTLTFDATVSDSIPSSPLLLHSECLARGRCETNMSNNSGETNVYAFPAPPPPRSDLALQLSVTTDTTLLVSGVMRPVVAPGGQFAAQLQIGNNGPDPAQQFVTWLLVPDSVQLSGFSLQPTRTAGDSLFWNMTGLGVGGSVTISFKGQASANLQSLPWPFVLRGGVRYEADPAPENNTDQETIVVVDPCNFLRPGQAQIRVNKQTVQVGDSVAVEVSLPDRVASWDVWVRYTDGEIDSTYWDAFIASAPLVANQWITLVPPWVADRLRGAGEQEKVTFEVRAADRCGNNLIAQASVTVRSSNDFVLKKNVFRPGAGDPVVIRFKLSSNRVARLDLYDITGYWVTKIAEGPYQAGWNELSWDGRTESGKLVGSGVYIVTIRSGNLHAWKKVIIVR